LAYAGTTRSNIQYLTVENEKLAQNLQVSRQEAKQLHATMQNAGFLLGELREEIPSEVSTIGETMQKLNDRFVTIHKAVFHLHGLQQWSKEFVKTLKRIQDTIAYVQEWTMQYKGGPLDLMNNMKHR